MERKYSIYTAMLFSIGLVSTFISGGLTGLIFRDSALDINVHDTYFVVAHFHSNGFIRNLWNVCWYISLVSKMYGKMMNKKSWLCAFLDNFISAYGVFYPMHFIGLAGVPRRYYSNTAFPMFDGLVEINELVTVFAITGAIAQIFFFF